MSKVYHITIADSRMNANNKNRKFATQTSIFMIYSNQTKGGEPQRQYQNPKRWEIESRNE